VIRLNASQSSQEIALAIVEDVQKYSVGAPYSDDKTLIVIKRG
jgi:serine phosphatase RsbU (regulator of sigma subunit)